MLKEIDIELPLFYSNYWAQNTEYLRVHYIKIYIFSLVFAIEMFFV